MMIKKNWLNTQRYNAARLLSGLEVDNPAEVTELICDMISK